MFDSDADPSSDSPYEVETVPAKVDELPLAVFVSHGKNDEVVLAVRALDGDGQLLSEFRTRASFEDGKTMRVRVFLGDACLSPDKLCSKAHKQTCYFESTSEAKAASCGPIYESETVEVEKPSAIHDWPEPPPPSPINCMDGGGADGGGCLYCDGGVPDQDGKCPTPCPAGTEKKGNECVCADGRVLGPDGRCSVPVPPCADGGMPGSECPIPMPSCADGGRQYADGGCSICADGGVPRSDGTCPVCADGGAPYADGGCPLPCKSVVPGASCDLVTQCGSTSDTKCAIKTLGITPVLDCMPKDPDMVLPYQACSESRRCSAGYMCTGPAGAEVCKGFCNSDTDCPNGRCIQVNLGPPMYQAITGVKVCLPSCKVDADCIGSQVCSGNVCVELKKPGETCTASAQCDGAAAGRSACAGSAGTMICVVVKAVGEACNGEYDTCGQQGVCVGAAGSAVCRALCKKSTDCSTASGGCCKMLSNSVQAACLPADFCTTPTTCAAGLKPERAACDVSSCCGEAAGTHTCVGDDKDGYFCQRTCTSRPVDNSCWSSKKCCAAYNRPGDAGVGGFCGPDDYCQ